MLLGAVHNGWRTRFFLRVSGQRHCGYRATAIDVSFLLRLRDRHRADVSPGRWLLPGWFQTRSSVQRVRPLYNGISIFKPYN